MQDKIFKVKIFEVTHKSVKVFSLEIFRLYGTIIKDILARLNLGAVMKFPYIDFYHN